MTTGRQTSRSPDLDPVEVVALTTIDGFGPATIRARLAAFRSGGRPIDDALPAGMFVEAVARAKALLAKGTKIGAVCLLDDDPRYPVALHDLENSPVALWMLGDPEQLQRTPRIAIVGTRDCTAYGERVTRSFAATFAGAGVTVVSGMAVGIDAMAHRAALEQGGNTIAVLGTGIDVPYPASHRSLHALIAAKGVVVSEGPPGLTAMKGCFPRRNRIIAALGNATIVVEAGVKSGALNTAEWAEGIGRQVAAVPGQIDSPASLGTNGLLRDGAHALATIEDALSLVGAERGQAPAIQFQTPSERVVWDALAKPAADIDTLCARTSLPPRICFETITTLEMRGLVDVTLTGEVRRR